MEGLVRMLCLRRDAPGVVGKAGAPGPVRSFRPEHGCPSELVLDDVVVSLRLTDNRGLGNQLACSEEVSRRAGGRLILARWSKAVLDELPIPLECLLDRRGVELRFL